MKNMVTTIVAILMVIFIIATLYLLNRNNELKKVINTYDEAAEINSNKVNYDYKSLSGLYDYIYEINKDSDEESESSTYYGLYIYDNGRYSYHISGNEFVSGHIGNYIVDENKLILLHLFSVNGKSIKKDTSTTVMTINEGQILTFEDNNRSIKLMMNNSKETVKEYLDNGKYSFNNYLNYKVVD